MRTVENGNDQLCSGEALFRQFNADALYFIIRVAYPGGVRKAQQVFADANSLLDYIARRAGDIGDY